MQSGKPDPRRTLRMSGAQKSRDVSKFYREDLLADHCAIKVRDKRPLHLANKNILMLYFGYYTIVTVRRCTYYVQSMQSIVVIAALVSMAFAIPPQTYDPEYDNFNADELVENVRLLTSYGKCFLDKGPCTAEGSDIKKIIPEALRTSCLKCTPKQQHLVRTVARAFQNKLPDLWDELVHKEDPKGEFREAFTRFLDTSDIVAL